MTAHELARHLLTCPDLPIATHANNHDYMSDERADGVSHGPLKIGLLDHYAGKHIIIGNISKRNLNPPNWRIIEMIVGDAPAEWTDF